MCTNKCDMDMDGAIMLGTGKFGGVLNQEISLKLIDTYRDLGGKVIDTGHCYGMFSPNIGRIPRSELTIGKYIQKNGVGDLLICTKGGYPDLDTKKSRLSKAEIMLDIEESLRCLGVDCVDIYYLHRDDESIPVCEIVSITDELVRSGKARAIGASNWSPMRVGAANDFARENHLEPFRFVQNLRNLGCYASCPMGDATMRITDPRDIDAFGCIPQIKFVAYSAQAYGFYSKTHPDDETTARRLLQTRYPFFDVEASIERLRRVWILAAYYGVAPSEIALAYVLSDYDSPAAVIGATSVEQLTETMKGGKTRILQNEILYLRGDSVCAR